MPSSIECRVRAADYDRKAEASENPDVKQFYRSLSQHWRSSALLTEAKIEREQAQRGQAEREQAERKQSAMMLGTRAAAKPDQLTARKR